LEDKINELQENSNEEMPQTYVKIYMNKRKITKPELTCKRASGDHVADAAQYLEHVTIIFPSH
jgi:hypothetical protein